MSRSARVSPTFRTLYHGSDTSNTFGTQYGLFLIRQSGVWAERWRTLNLGQQSIPPPPLIDLARETVIVLAVGKRPVLGFDVTIEDVTLRNETLIVTATETRIVGGGFDEICSPAHVVAARVDPRAFEKMLLNLEIRVGEHY